MNNLRPALITLLANAVLACEAFAGPCDAYYPFDGTLADASGNGYDGLMITREGDEPGPPQFVDGRFGRALHVTGGNAMRAFLDLHYDACPQFTFTAWFQLPSLGQSGNQYIVSTGTGGNPGIRVSGKSLIVSGQGNGLGQSDAVRDASSWFFVAAVYDYKARTYTLYWRNRSQEGKLSESPYAPEDSFWVGTNNDSMSGTAGSLYVDDLRIYGRALSADEVREASTSRPSATAPVAGAAALPACNTHAECGPGTYCALDNTCHPDRHAPKRDIQVGQLQVPLISLNPPGDSDGPTLAELQQQLAERNASRVDVSDYESPTALLEEMRSADAERRANSPPEEPPPQRESTDPPKVVGWRLSDSDVNQTPVSGTGGEIVRVLDMEDRALSGIEIFEPNNVPCFIRLHAAGDRPGESLNECTTTVIPAIDLSVWNVAVIDPAAVTSARVCHSFQGNNRVKGILVSGYMIKEDGSTGFYQQGQGDGPNCSSWQSVIFCDTGYVASGIVAHFKDRNLSESLTGIQLICRKIQKIYD